VFVLASQNLNQEDLHFIQSKTLVKGIEGERCSVMLSFQS
jgi:hypothetical protein